VIAEKVETPPMSKSQHHLTFFRQSGWMMVATFLGGLMMFLLHKVAKQMPKEEYSVFLTLLAVVGQMSIPTMGLQGIFMQQAAASLNPEHEKELAGMLRGVLRGTFVLWLLMVAVIFLLQNRIMPQLGIVNPMALWITALTGLAVLWKPLMLGILQGRQNFLWAGWATILEGVVRFGGVLLLVGLLGYYAAGAMAAVLIATSGSVIIGAWFSRDCFQGKAAPMNWSAWLARVVPLTLGLGVGSFMTTADMIFVQSFFSKKDTGYYGAAGMIGRALIYFTAPLTAVMFPKIARGVALGQESGALKLTLMLTALAGGGAALLCTVMPTLPLRILYDQTFIDRSGPLVPWFAWSMLPLTLSTVLINSLMARSRFVAVPWLLAVALGYGLTLYWRHDSFQIVIQDIGCFGVILLAVCAWFSFYRPRSKISQAPV
jgi:O-antigen/teichoic acid export membrane protein